MRYPLDSITVTGAFREVAVPGTGLPDASGVKRHIGVDLRTAYGNAVGPVFAQPVYAVGDGVVTMSYSGTAGQTIEIRIGNLLWRFMHLSRRDVTVGQKVTQGQVIALSGNSGGVLAHLHVDCRRDGTTYNASLDNYFDPLATIKATLGESKMTPQEEANAYRIVLNRPMEHGGSGRTGYKFIVDAEGELKSQRQAVTDSIANLNKQVATLQTTITNIQNKPPEVVIQEVEKIVEKIVKVEVPVEVIKEVEPSWLVKVRDFINNFLGRK